MKCGMRVVRGPDWKWSNQDGGQGHLGTVIGVSRVNRTCMVQWDVGTVTECRAGGEGLADLRIFDNEQTGVQQHGYCDICQVEQKQDIRGFRWKCLNCKDFDLCNACYMMDKHDKTHPFIRLKSLQSVIVTVPPRRRSRRVKLYGISEGAKVKRVQSGGLKLKHADEIGEVIEFVDMLPLSYHGGVKVKWPSGETSNHRLGADGKVDLVMVESHQYSYPVYLDHLPVGDLTQPFETLINIGDKVCVDLNLDTAQKIQVEFGGWNQQMEKVLGEVGTVVALDRNTCEIQYDRGRWWFYHGACRKVSIIEEGDTVKVIENESRVKNLQGRHGGWTDDMKSILGDVGVVVSIDPDVGDLEVKFKDSTYLLNMSCCVKYDGDTVSRPQTTKPMTVLEDLLGLNQQLLTQAGLPRMAPTPPLQPLPPPDTEGSFMLQPGLPSSDEEEESDNNSLTTEPQDDNQGSGGSAAESDSEEQEEEDDDDDDDDDDDTVIFHLNGMTIGKGLRVVRGQDWKWGDQDGGKGHLGTVVELGLQRQDNVPPQCVIIQWDEGNRNTYRVGFENSYDLRVYDNAGLGVKREARCDGDCGEAEIMGFLWKCATCRNVNLCSQCYHAEKHDIKHPFHRIDSPGEEPVSVPKRQICQRNRVYGIFEGAKVVRGPDWRWRDQDGNSEGEVIAIVNFSFDSDRDAAEVTWSNGHTNVYRLGYKGALDVKYTSPAIGGTYFPDHLPILKLPKEEEILEPAATTPETTEPDTASSIVLEDDGRLKKGDIVHVGCDPDTLKAIQKSVGGWNENMVDCIGEEGEVLLINNGNVTVKFKSGKWTLSVMCLEKVNPIQKGCVVRVDPDEWKVRRLQGSLWSVELQKVIGKKGLVQSVDENGVEVKFGPMTFQIKSDCLTIVTGEVPDDIPEFEEHQEEEQEETTVAVPEPDKMRDLIPASPELIDAVHNGVIETIQNLVKENPDLVNSVDGKTPVLHVAVIRGNDNVVEKLLQLGADKEIRNEEDSTPLLTAVKFKKLECVRLLIHHGADVNAINNNQQTSIHLAVQNKDTEILKLFKSTKKCKINIKDKLGDSAVTDAINIGDNETMRIILEWPNVDLKFVNVQGFSPIHFAARKGELQAVRLILQKSPDVLNSQKKDGYSALHLAACMDHHDIADHLIHLKGIDLEARTTEEGLTPLHIACRYASAKTVEGLINAVQARSDAETCTGLFSVDKNGNNALHHCLMGKPEIMEMSRMQKNESKITHEQSVDRCKIIKQLIRFGVPYNKPNKNGVTASGILRSGKLWDELQKCINEREQQLKSKPDARPKIVFCRNCEEDGVKTPAKLKLEPCDCTLCEDCCGAKPRKCPNCNQRVTNRKQLK